MSDAAARVDTMRMTVRMQTFLAIDAGDLPAGTWVDDGDGHRDYMPNEAYESYRARKAAMAEGDDEHHAEVNGDER